MIKETMINIFNNYAHFIVMLHVVGAIIWVGGMIAIRFAVHPITSKIEDPNVRLETTLKLLKRFFNIVIIGIFFIIITAGLMAIGLGFKGTPLYIIVHIKEAIWTTMAIIFTMIYLRRNKAQKYFNQNDLKNAKETLAPLPKWMIPANIILGIIALYFGITLRGF